MDLDEAIRSRRCVRGFRPTPVPEPVLADAFALAQWAPSNCNVQPWRVFLASGARREALRAALCAAVERGELPDSEIPIDTFPPPYRRLQVECAKALYEPMGIERHDAAGRFRALLRNFEFFDAPHVAIICMERSFSMGVALDVGIYLQTLMLALWARGIGSCPQASLRQYASIVRRELGIRDDLLLLCGLSLGYEDPSVPANACRQTREGLEANLTRLD
jgi:hypothetical protein